VPINLPGDRPSILQGDCITKYIFVWGINISLRVKKLRKNKGFYLAVFKGNLLKHPICLYFGHF
jgi:hypothetical protein